MPRVSQTRNIGIRRSALGIKHYFLLCIDLTGQLTKETVGSKGVACQVLTVTEQEYTVPHRTGNDFICYKYTLIEIYHKLSTGCSETSGLRGPGNKNAGGL